MAGQDWFLEGGVLQPLLRLASDPNDTCRCVSKQCCLRTPVRHCTSTAKRAVVSPLLLSSSGAVDAARQHGPGQ